MVFGARKRRDSTAAPPSESAPPPNTAESGPVLGVCSRRDSSAVPPSVAVPPSSAAGSGSCSGSGRRDLRTSVRIAGGRFGIGHRVVSHSSAAAYDTAYLSERDIHADEVVPAHRVRQGVGPSAAELRDCRTPVGPCDAFEVRVVGVMATAHDSVLAGGSHNELFVYSTQELSEEGASDEGERVTIHYDALDGCQPTRPCTMVDIPASKSIVLAADPPEAVAEAAAAGTPLPLRRVDLRIIVKEFDDVSAAKAGTDLVAEEAEKLAKAAVATAGENVSKKTGGVPSLATAGIRTFFRLTHAGVNAGLDAAGRPDHILDVHPSFVIVPPSPAAAVPLEEDPSTPPTPPTPAGEPLRYGWYFFLSAPTPARLFVQTATSGCPQLLTAKMPPLTAKRSPLRSGERPPSFQPLTHLSYLVVQVSRRIKTVAVQGERGGGAAAWRRAATASAAVARLRVLGVKTSAQAPAPAPAPAPARAVASREEAASPLTTALISALLTSTREQETRAGANQGVPAGGGAPRPPAGAPAPGAVAPSHTHTTPAGAPAPGATAMPGAP